MRKVILLFFIAVMGFGLSDCALAADKEEIVVVESDDEGSGSAFLGIYMSDLTDEVIDKNKYPEKNGVLIIEVIEDSPAEKAKLMEGDIIHTFGGEEVEDSEGLAGLVAGRSPGDEVEIVFFRKGDRKRVKIELAERKKDQYTVEYDWQAYADKMGRIGERIGRSVGSLFDMYIVGKRLEGFELSELDSDLAEYFDVDADGGVLVTKVREDSPASKVGIKSGDVITRVDKKKVSSIEEYEKALDETEGDVLIEVQRKGKKLEFNLKGEDLEIPESMLYGDRNIYHLQMPPQGEKRIILKNNEKNMREFEKKLEKMKMEGFSGHNKVMILREEELEDKLEKIHKKLQKLEERLKEIERERD